MPFFKCFLPNPKDELLTQKKILIKIPFASSKLYFQMYLQEEISIKRTWIKPIYTV